ncbi:haloacid dehalogenase-like hydrolase family protein isoform X2 [Wolffia australiana]
MPTTVAEMLRHDVAVAMKVASELLGSDYKTRDASINGLRGFKKIEVSVLLCNDSFIQKLNKEWRDEDKATDVLSMSQHIPELDLPILMLGDLVISVETATRQAEERGHTLLDEIRILVVHGLLHLLGFDHEMGDLAEREMEQAEELVLKNLGWRGKGLIRSTCDEPVDEIPKVDTTNAKQSDDPVDESPKVDTTNDGVVKNMKKSSRGLPKPKFQYIFCDMDGTLLNSKSRVSSKNVEALKEASSKGVNIIIATGKTRPAVINVLKKADLTGKHGIGSEYAPGVFLQGLLIYGRQGREISRRNLDHNVCREAFLYSLERKIPLVAFSQDRCFTPFDDPLVEALHSVYHEPRAEVAPSIDHLLSMAEIQKLLFFDTPDGVSNILRPHWAEATKGRAGVVQAQADMLEIVPPQTSKGTGVRMLLDHLNVHPEEIMAIGDGENDVEMLQLASFSVALKNGSEKAKSVADVVGPSNDEDGVAEAIYRYVL